RVEQGLVNGVGKTSALNAGLQLQGDCHRSLWARVVETLSNCVRRQFYESRCISPILYVQLRWWTRSRLSSRWLDCPLHCLAFSRLACRWHRRKGLPAKEVQR